MKTINKFLTEKLNLSSIDERLRLNDESKITDYNIIKKERYFIVRCDSVDFRNDEIDYIKQKLNPIYRVGAYLQIRWGFILSYEDVIKMCEYYQGDEIFRIFQVPHDMAPNRFAQQWLYQKLNANNLKEFYCKDANISYRETKLEPISEYYKKMHKHKFIFIDKDK